MKTLKIEVPEGYEIDKKKSTFEEIFFKKISPLPLSVFDIPNRNWFINEEGDIEELVDNRDITFINELSTKERAEAFLALMQLVELRDAWNADWKADWSNDLVIKYTIEIINEEIVKEYCYKNTRVLNFKTPELRNQFAEQFKELIFIAKELL